MFGHPAFFAGLGVFCGAAFVVGRNVLQKRKERRRRQRREQLRSLGRRNGLELQGRHLPEEVVEGASWFRGARHEVSVDDVLSGQDNSGRYRIGRRVIDGEEHHYLESDVRFNGGLDGLHIEPRSEASPVTRWWQRWQRPARRPHSSMRLQWETRASVLQDRDAMMGVCRLTEAVAKGCSGRDALPMGLEVTEGSLLIHSTETLDGTRLAEFLRRGLILRGHAMNEIARRNSQRVQAAVTTAQERIQAEEAKKDTRPLFTVPVAEGALDDGAATVTLSAEELLREVPDPRQQKRRKKPTRKYGFEIPEPEEEVVLIKAQ